MINITTENKELAIYTFVQNIVNEKYASVPEEDRLDMIQDVYLSMYENYLRNGDKYYFKYTAKQIVCRYCDAWIKKNTVSSVSLNNVQLMYVIDDSQARYKEICQLLNEHTQLHPRDAQIIQLYIVDERSMSDIGKKMNLNTERVRQIVAHILRQYRKTCCKLGMTDCL